MVRLATLLLVGCCLAPSAPAATESEGAPVWLVDPAARKKPAMIIEDTYRPVLDPDRGQHVFPMADLPAGRTLCFFIGLKDIGEEGSVRFELLLTSPNGEEPIVLYRQELSRPGWIEGRVDLAEHNRPGNSLVFRKSLVEGSLARFARSAWGDPVLLPRRMTKRPSVVIISIDTLRADHVGAYGRAPSPTSALDALAASGTLYAQAYSPST